MNNLIICWLLIILLLSSATFAQAQQQPKVAKLGWLSGRPASRPGLDRFLPELRELGYIEGKNITIEARFAENKFDRLPALADELVRLKVDVILIPSTIEALAAKNATKTIPIVFVNVADPVASGLIDSLARPGGNITGMTNFAVVLAGKRLELLKETVPKLTRVAVLWDPQAPGSAQQWKESQLPARELGLQLHSMEVSKVDDLESAFKAATKVRSNGLSVTQSPPFLANQKLITELATKNKLPAIYNREDWIENGGLMAYGPDNQEPHKRAAYYVDRILKGASPSDLPVEQPTKFELVINFQTAKALNLTIPPIVLMRAQRVVK